MGDYTNYTKELRLNLHEDAMYKELEKPSCTLVLLTDNCEKKIETCLINLIKQTYKNFEIIILDKSEDFTSGIINALRFDTRIKYFDVIKQNIKFDIDSAIKLATTNKVLVLQPKDYLNEDYIENLINKNSLKELPFVNYYKKGKICSEIKASILSIDLVYTWVDSSDPRWIEKKSQYDEMISKCNKDAVDKCRFCNNDELKYSLRSVEKYAPWIHKIYILTDEQKPEWLNLDNPKIEIIDHKDVIPNDKLPTYNACTIENAIPYIKNLSEYYIYANDDMMFWNQTSPEFFFKNGLPIVRIKERIKKYKKYKHLYGAMIYKAYSLIKKSFNKDFPYFSHHNIDAYKKTMYLKCINDFKTEFDNTISNRFRDFSDMQRMIVSYYSLFFHQAILKDANQNVFQKLFNIASDSEYFNVRKNTLNKILKTNTHLMCLNDCRKTTDEDRKNLKAILNTKFPEKSEYEV